MGAEKKVRVEGNMKTDDEDGGLIAERGKTKGELLTQRGEGKLNERLAE